MGGGVVCYVRSNIPHRPRPDISYNSHNIESIVIDVQDKYRRCFYVMIYKSPSTPCRYMISALSNIMDKCLAECEMVVLFGDLNINLLKPNHELVDLMESYNLKNIIKGATCFKSINNPSLIDVILTNKPKSLAGHLNCHIGMSDFHNFICSSSKFNVTTIEKTKVKYRSFRNFCERSFLHDVCSLTTDDCVYTSIDSQVENYISKLKTIVDKHAPFKTRYRKSNHVSYMNESLLKAINVKGMLFRKYMKNPTAENHNKYRKQRNDVTRMKRESVQSYFDKKCNAVDQNAKSFWNTIKPFFSNKCNKSSGKINLVENSKMCTDVSEVCDIFNEYFVNVGAEITSNGYTLDDLDSSENNISV